VKVGVPVASVRSNRITRIPHDLTRFDTVPDADMFRPLNQVPVHRDVAIIEEDNTVVGRGPKVPVNRDDLAWGDCDHFGPALGGEVNAEVDPLALAIG
jgi:hypothetical protein